MHGFPEWFMPLVMLAYYAMWVAPVLLAGFLVWLWRKRK